MRLPIVAAMLVTVLSMPAWASEEKAADTPALPANEWHGTVGCAKCDFGDTTSAEECQPAVKTADGVFILKAAASAPPAVKEYLVRIQNKEMIGEYLIKGEKSELDGKKFVAVTSMVAKPLPKPTATLSLNRKKTTGGSKTADADKGGGEEEGGGGGGRRGRGRRGRSNDGGGEEGEP